MDKETIEELRQQLNIDIILERMQKEKVIVDAKAGIGSLLFYRGKGCKQCNNTGYKGRIGIYETLEITKEIADLILKKADNKQLLEQAKKQGLMPIVDDGFIKAKNGITTLEEVMRVSKE